ncbi:MAG: hypothetical protein K6E87_01710 [bacterium]|nr:hypothetical protein [bacterium]
MLYDKYVEKIKKVAKTKGVIMFFKFVFLAIFLLALLFSITFIANKGKLKKGIEMPSEINYGEDYDFSAQTQFGGSVRYFEYRAENSTEWSREKPILAGNYYVRAVTSKFIGKRTSAEFGFTINKTNLEINLTSDTITYGDYPSYSQTGLKNKDSISEIVFNFDSFNLTKTNVEVGLVKVSDVNGIDVTNCYNITSNGKEIGFNKKKITITPTMDSSYVYSGEEIKYQNTYTINTNLGYSDKSVAEGKIYDLAGNETKAILPGNYKVKITSYKLSNATDDVSINYDVTTSEYNFSIVKRDITIETGSNSKVYDNTPLTDTTYNVASSSAYGLISGDKLVDLTTENQSITYYAENGIKNVRDIRIYDSENNDITNNLYNVTYNYGTLFINKKDVTIETTSDDTFVFDGNTHSRATLSDLKITSGSILSSDELYLISGSQPQISAPGKVINAINYSIRNTSTQIDVKNSYNINRIDGELIMYSKGITIKSKDVSSVYGNDYSLDENKYFELTETYTGFDADIINNTRVEVEYYKNNEKVTPKDVGEYQIRIKSVETIEKYSINISTATYGILTITPKPITISLKSLDKTEYKYSGNVVSYKDEFNNFNITSGALVYNDSLKISVNYYENSNLLPNAPKNVGSYNIVYNSYVDLNGNSSNYTITSSNSLSFKITKRNITFSLDNLSEKIYDGLAYDYSNATYKIIGDGFAANESITPVLSAYLNGSITTPIDRGNYELGISSLIYNNALESNYNVYYSSRVALVINARTVEVAFNNINGNDKEYDGLPLTYSNDYNNFTIISGSILPGHSIKISYNFYAKNSYSTVTPINANDYVIRYSDYTVNGTNKNNYYIICSDRACKINKRTIEIAPNDLVVTYGQTISYNEGFKYISTNTIVDSGTFSINVKYYDGNYNEINPNHLNAGTYFIGTYSYTTNIANFNNNYNVIYKNNYATLTVNKYNVSISLLNMLDVYYNGKDIVYPSGYNNYQTSTTMPYSSERISINVSYQKKVNGIYVDTTSTKDCGEYRVIYSSFNTSPDYVKSNYNVIWDNEVETFKIIKKELIISLFDDSTTYGNTYVYPNNTFTVSGLASSESILVNAKIYNGSEFVPTSDTKLLNVGVYDIIATIDDIILTGSSLDNYDVTINNSNLEIVRRDLYISLIDQQTQIVYNGLAHYYDDNSFNQDGLVNGDKLEISVIYDNGSTINPIDANTYVVSISNHTITRNNVNLNNNYNTHYVNNVNLTISKKDIIISLLDQTITYGDTFNYPTYPTKQYEIIDGSLVNGEKISLSVSVYNGTNPISNTDVAKLNVGNYDIKHTSIDLLIGRSINNYNFVRVNSSILTINKKNVELTLKEFAQAQYKYNGENAYYYDGYNNYSVATGLVNDDAIEVFVDYYNGNIKLESAPKNVGSYYVKFNSYIDNHGVGTNYNIIASNMPEFEITKRNVIVTPNLIGPFVYDGSVIDVSVSGLSIAGDDFAYGEGISPIYGVYENNVATNPKDAGTYEQRIISYNGIGSYSDSNYNLTLVSSYFTISKKELTILPNDIISVFNNSEYERESYYYNTNVNNERFLITVSYYDLSNNPVNPKDAATYIIRVKDSDVVNDTANKKNYVLSYSDATLTINPLEITIMPKYYSNMDNLVYSATAYEYSNSGYNYIVIGSNNFYNDDAYDFRITPLYKKYNGSTYVNVDSAINAGDYRVYVDEILGNNTNYIVSKADDYISFSIAKYVINAEFSYLPSATKTYDGIIYKATDYYDYDNSIFSAPDDIQLMIKPVIIKDNQQVSEAKNVGLYKLILSENTFEVNYGIKDNYIVIMNEYEFSITQINLSVTISDYSQAYTGSAILDENYDGYVINNENDMVDGETLRLHFIYKKNGNIIISPTEVGTYEIVYGYYDVNDLYPEVYNYKISAENATLSINRIELSVYASSRDDSLEEINYLYTGNLIDESKIKVYAIGLQDEDSITSYTLEYFDNDGNPIDKPKEIGYYYARIKSVEINNGLRTSNYDIRYDLHDCPLTVKGGDISITLINNSDITRKVYGEVINPSNYIILNSSNSIIVSSTYNNYHSNNNYVFSVVLQYDGGIIPKNVGTYDISLGNILINGSVVDSNLFTSITLSPSSCDLSIDQKEITIEAITKDYNYDYTYDGHYIDRLKNNVGYILYDENGIIITDLPYDDELTGVNIIYTDLNGIECSPINAGNYYVSVNPNFTRSSNYKYTLKSNELVINKALISAEMIKTQIENRIYDGNETDKNKVINNYNILINGEVNFITNEISGLNEVISLVFSTTFNSTTKLLDECEIKDAYKYTFSCTDFNITDGIKSNYKLGDIDSSNLIINKRNVTLKTGNYNGVYDGIAHNILTLLDVTSIDLENAGLATNDIAYNITTNPSSITDYGVKENNEVIAQIKDNLEIDRTNNYIITLEFGTLSVMKKNIHIKTLGNDSLVYTGSRQYFNEYKVVVDGIEYDSFIDVPDNLALITGENAICSSKVVLLDANTYLNEISFEVTKSNYSSSTDNYNFIFDEIGEIIINKLDVEFELVSDGFLKVYDNKPYVFTNDDCDNVFVEQGEFRIFIEFVDEASNHITEFIDAKQYSNLRVLIFDILDSNNNSRKNNYNISITNKDNCNFEITRKEILINTSSKTKDCDGIPLTNYDFIYVNATDQEFLTTNKHTVYSVDEYLPRITYVGEIDNDLTNAIRVKDDFNNYVTSNYKFIVNTMGKLTINKLSIKTKPNNTVEYSGFDLDINKTINVGLTPIGKSLKITCNDYIVLKYDETLEEYVLALDTIELGKYRVLLSDYTVTKGTTNITSTIGVIGGNTLNEGEKFIFDGISYYYADFEIIPCQVTVKPSEKEVGKTYDGIGLELAHDFYDRIGNLFTEHTLKVYWSDSISKFETGSKKVSIIDAKVFDINGNDVTYNYNITIDSTLVKLIVNKRYIEIETESIERLFNPGIEIYSEYNGPTMELDYNSMYNTYLAYTSDSEMGLLEGHRFVLTDRIISRLSYCGSIENKIKNYVIYDDEGNIVTDCYYKPICSGELTLDSIISFDFDIQNLIVENITVYDKRTNTTTVYSRSNGTLGYFDTYISNEFNLHYSTEVKNEVLKIKFYDNLDNAISQSKLLKYYGIDLYY